MKENRGFTLIELMITVVIVAFLAAIAIPSYQSYTRKVKAAEVQQEILKLVEQLERYKSRNFSYRGFDPKYLYDSNTALSEIKFPSATKTDYVITLADVSTTTPTTLLSTATGKGKRWAIKAIPTAIKYDAFLISNHGIRCKKTYLVANDLVDINAYTGCGTGSEKW